jgi:hypothetical protein
MLTTDVIFCIYMLWLQRPIFFLLYYRMNCYLVIMHRFRINETIFRCIKKRENYTN